MNPDVLNVKSPYCPCAMWWFYPHMVACPYLWGGKICIRCLGSGYLWTVVKKSCWSPRRKASTDEPGVNVFSPSGPWHSILQMLKLPDGTVKSAGRGLQRAYFTRCLTAAVSPRRRKYLNRQPLIEREEQEVLVRTAISQFEGYIAEQNSAWKC